MYQTTLINRIAVISIAVIVKINMRESFRDMFALCISCQLFGLIPLNQKTITADKSIEHTLTINRINGTSASVQLPVPRIIPNTTAGGSKATETITPTRAPVFLLTKESAPAAPDTIAAMASII